jgi:septin family protein
MADSAWDAAATGEFTTTAMQCTSGSTSLAASDGVLVDADEQKSASYVDAGSRSSSSSSNSSSSVGGVGGGDGSDSDATGDAAGNATGDAAGNATGAVDDLTFGHYGLPTAKAVGTATDMPLPGQLPGPELATKRHGGGGGGGGAQRHRMPKLQLDAMAQQSGHIALNIMVVGESGLGKTTFAHLFCSCLPHDPDEMAPHDGSPTVGEPTTIFNHEFKKKGVEYKFSAVDAAGFELRETKTVAGHPVDQEANFKPIMQYIHNQQNKWANSTDADGFSDQSDGRIHCVFYFVRPHRVQDIDLNFMQRFSKVTNVVPIIAKADTLTRDELTKQLRELQRRLAERNVPIFDFKEHATEGVEFLLPEAAAAAAVAAEEQGRAQRRSFLSVGATLATPAGPPPSPPPPQQQQQEQLLPRVENVFAVIAAHKGTKRVYTYGTADPEDPRHSDFVRLANLLFGEEAAGEAFRDLTWRAKKLANQRIKSKTMAQKITDSPKTPPSCIALVALSIVVNWCTTSQAAGSEPPCPTGFYRPPRNDPHAAISTAVWWLSALVVLASFLMGTHSKSKQSLAFRYQLDTVTTSIAFVACAFLVLLASGSAWHGTTVSIGPLEIKYDRTWF